MALIERIDTAIKKKEKVIKRKLTFEERLQLEEKVTKRFGTAINKKKEKKYVPKEIIKINDFFIPYLTISDELNSKECQQERFDTFYKEYEEVRNKKCHLLHRKNNIVDKENFLKNPEETVLDKLLQNLSHMFISNIEAVKHLKKGRHFISGHDDIKIITDKIHIIFAISDKNKLFPIFKTHLNFPNDEIKEVLQKYCDFMEKNN